MSQIQSHIKDLREQQSQAQIAAELGVSQSLISRWEAGDIPAAADVALSLAKLHRARTRRKAVPAQPKEQAHG